MKYCWSASDKRENQIVPFLIAAMIVCIPGIVTAMTAAPDNHGRTVSIIIMLLLAALFPVWYAVIGSRRYAIDETGMTIRYPFGFTVKHRWEEFSEIALCHVHHSSGRNTHILAIRCVLGREEDGPGQAITARERWATREYELFHFRKVITIYFNKHRYGEFISRCPLPIKDYRNLPEGIQPK